MSKVAKAKVNYIADMTGKVRKISEMRKQPTQLVRQPTILQQSQPQQQMPARPTTRMGKIKEWFWPSTVQERVVRHQQLKDAAFFTVVTGSLIMFEDQIMNFLVKETTA